MKRERRQESFALDKLSTGTHWGVLKIATICVFVAFGQLLRVAYAVSRGRVDSRWRDVHRVRIRITAEPEEEVKTPPSNSLVRVHGLPYPYARPVEEETKRCVPHPDIVRVRRASNAVY